MTRISSGYWHEASIQLLSAGRQSSNKNTPKSFSSEQASRNTILNKIEKHISDVKKGQGDASKDVAQLLGRLHANASTLLAGSNPRAYAMYSGYLSALRYDRAARFVSGVESGLSAMQPERKGTDVVI